MDTVSPNKSAPPKTTIDTRYRCETPEGIILEVELAGPIARTLAYSIDLCIRFAVLIGLSLALSIFGEAGIGVLLIAAFAAEWFYPVFFELFRHGQTPGKKAFNLRVVQDNLTPVSIGNSLTRNLLRAADFLPMVYAFGFASMLLNKDFKRLGDITAGTLVIHDAPEHTSKGSVDNVSSVSARAPLFNISFEEQAAITDYADRLNQFSEERQHELASILAKVYEVKPQQTRQEVLATAAWLIGKDTL